VHNSAPRPDQNDEAAFTAEDLAVIRREVRAFVVAHPEVRWEFDDLVQELSVHWLERRPEYDPTRGASRGTFLRVVSRH
jgi:DNA-directed RNA polymerase specialized sigma24 family protein